MMNCMQIKLINLTDDFNRVMGVPNLLMRVLSLRRNKINTRIAKKSNSMKLNRIKFEVALLRWIVRMLVEAVE